MNGTRELQSVLYANAEWEMVTGISLDFSCFILAHLSNHILSSKSSEYLLLNVYHIINMQAKFTCKAFFTVIFVHYWFCS